MAITNEEVKNEEVVPGAGGNGAANGGKNDDASKEARKVMAKQGAEIISSMTDEEKAVIGSKSHTLHFVQLLGLASKRSSRAISATNESRPCPTAVGITLYSDEPINVPKIDVRLDKDTGIDPEKDITFRAVAAGEKFNLNYYEFMFLIVQPEYSGYCSNAQNPQGIVFIPRMPAYLESRAKLPTPTINFAPGAGSIKAGIFEIDELVPGTTDQYVIKPEYEAEFGALLKKAKPVRDSAAGGTRGSGAAASPYTTSTLIAVSLHKMLYKGVAAPAAPAAAAPAADKKPKK